MFLDKNLTKFIETNTVYKGKVQKAHLRNDSHFFLLMDVQYVEGDLIQHMQDHLYQSFPVLFHSDIYFFASKETRNTFMINPIRYLRQPKPNPSLPIKLAIIGSPKSGKTTGQ